MNAYEKLEHHFRRISQLDHVQAFLGWDEAVMMPAGGGEARGEALATLNVILHEKVTDPEIGDLLEDARVLNDLTDWQRANLEQMRRAWSQAVCIPSDLVGAMSKTASRCEQAWRTLRADNDWASLLPLLDALLSLVRQSAQLRAEDTGLAPYDALLDLYEPGISTERIEAVFGELKSFLPGLLANVLERQARWDLKPLRGPFPVERQRELGLAMMKSLGFDFDHGRLDVSHHPFTGGVPDDTRITTRYRSENFIDALMAVLHETGHAMYQQGLPGDWRDQPVGESLGTAIHESQSLLMEMQACRSREFLSYMLPHAIRIFEVADTSGEAWSIENVLRHYTRVARSKIRVEADEVTYPLHIILRFELEQALLSGALPLKDLPDAWNEKMLQYLGIGTSGDDRDGCMQDVHWMAGIFGYFPTYSLGAMTAAQLYASALDQVPGIPAAIGRGDFSPLLGWLRENVHGKGRLISADEMLKSATGSTLDPRYFRAHLERRYLGD